MIYVIFNLVNSEKVVVGMCEEFVCVLKEGFSVQEVVIVQLVLFQELWVGCSDDVLFVGVFVLQVYLGCIYVFSKQYEECVKVVMLQVVVVVFRKYVNLVNLVIVWVGMFK